MSYRKCDRTLFTLIAGKCKPITVKSESKIAHGVETFFFPITAKRGLKLFAEKENAQNSLRRQRKAAKHGVGPEVLSKRIFQVIVPVHFLNVFNDSQHLCNFRSMFLDDICYGYYTQIIKMVESEKDYTDQEEEELIKKCYKLFPEDSLDDIHDGNVGRIKGKLVMVDFGDESAS